MTLTDLFYYLFICQKTFIEEGFKKSRNITAKSSAFGTPFEEIIFILIETQFLHSLRGGD